MPERNVNERHGDALSYARVAENISKPKTTGFVKRLLDDSWYNIKREVKKEGHSSACKPDGLIRMPPFDHKGFKIEIFGQLTHTSPVDVYGKVTWIGTAEATIRAQGKEFKMIFDIENQFHDGLAEPKDAAAYLVGLVEQFRSPKQN